MLLLSRITSEVNSFSDQCVFYQILYKEKFLFLINLKASNISNDSNDKNIPYISYLKFRKSREARKKTENDRSYLDQIKCRNLMGTQEQNHLSVFLESLVSVEIFCFMIQSEDCSTFVGFSNAFDFIPLSSLT
jgi:hypothetical protein